MKQRIPITCPSCDTRCTLWFTAPDHVQAFELFCPFCAESIGDVVDEDWPDSGEDGQ